MSFPVPGLGMVVGTKPAIRNDLILARRVLAGGQPGTNHHDNG